MKSYVAHSISINHYAINVTEKDDSTHTLPTLYNTVEEALGVIARLKAFDAAAEALTS